MKKIEKSRLPLIADKSSHICNNTKNIKVSIDRITLVAPLSLEAWERHYKKWLLLPFIQNKGAGIQIIDSKSNKGKKQQIAYVEVPRYHTEEIRIDFNPNHSMNTPEGKWLKNILQKLPNKHITRLDIAIDIFNYPEIYNYDFYVFGTSKKNYFNRQRKLETTYWGTRSSQQQIRLYNKKTEQKKKGNTVNFQSWWRLEFQFRGNKTTNYYEIINKMLDNFITTDYTNPNLTDNEQNKLLRMTIDDNYYGSKNKTAQRRLRELIKKVELIEKAKSKYSLSEKIKKVFNTSSKEIDKELYSYLNYFNSYPRIGDDKTSLLMKNR